MKKLMFMSAIFFLVGLATTEVMGQNPVNRQTSPSSSRTQTTVSSNANSSASRQMRKGDTQLNKANSNYQRAQSSTVNRTTTSSTNNRVNTSSTARPSTPAANNRTTTSSANGRPATSTTTVTRTPSSTTSNSTPNRAASPTTNRTTTSAASTASRNSSPNATANSNDYTKRGYTQNGQARPQQAPTNNASDANHGHAPKPTPFVHPNHHNFGGHMNVPPRIRPVYYHGHPYYFYNSLFCRYINGYYVICRPPIGAVIAYSIFNSWKPVIVVHKNVNYYYDDGSFYRPAPNKVDYVVVDPPIGARVAELPSNYEEIVLDNQVYFKVDNVYYKEVVVSGYLWYEVVFVS